MKKGPEMKLTIQPLYLTLHHDYVFEGPCRYGTAEQLTAEFDLMLNAEAVKASIQEVCQTLAPLADLCEPIHIDHNEEFLVNDEILEEMSVNDRRVDVYLVAGMTRMTDLMIPFAQKVRKPLVMLPSVSATQTIMPAALLARGLEVYAFRNWADTIELLEVLRVRKALANTRVLCAARFGTARTVSGMDNFVDLEHVTDVLGTQFTFVNAHELLDQTHLCDPSSNPTTPGRRALNPDDTDRAEIEALTDALMDGAAECDMTRKDVFSSVRAYVTIRKFLDYYNCNAFSAPCPDLCATRRLNEERYTFCLTHSLLGEEGIPSACEYDLSAALSMMLLSSFMHAPAYMGNTTHNPSQWKDTGVALHRMMHDIGDTEYKARILKDPDNTIFVWHAVPRRNMGGFGQPFAPYSIRPFASSGFGATIRYDFNRDIGQTVTMARIDPSCSKLFTAKAQVVAGRGYEDHGCSEGVFLRVKDGRDFFSKQICFGNHIPLVYGDCVEKVALLGKVLGLEVVEA